MSKFINIDGQGSDVPAARKQQILVKVAENFEDLLADMQISDDLLGQLNDIYIPLAALLKTKVTGSQGTLIVGINGAQGAGKSTLCNILEMVLQRGFGLNTATLSIDDIYLTRDERKALAKNVHPLLLTRGVPGTHDTTLGIRCLDELSQPESTHSVQLPVFDKAIDDRLPVSRSKEVQTPIDVVLFEGWCVGARPQPEAELDKPINSLEVEEDKDARWRRFVNEQLAASYKQLFGRLDLLIMLKIPSFESVYEWRSLQERKLAASAADKTASHVMDEAALQRFIMHYERLTRYMLAEMPQRADIVLKLNRDHTIEEVVYQRSKAAESQS